MGLGEKCEHCAYKRLLKEEYGGGVCILQNNLFRNSIVQFSYMHTVSATVGLAGCAYLCWLYVRAE
jgi:hypothetical protein